MAHLSFLFSAALLLIAPRALAQTYDIGSQMTGEPRSSAQFGDEDQLGFSELSSAQIAADVTTQFNSRTGDKEYLAPTFDPFEDDDALAGTVNLRSMDGARDLDGERLVGGVLLDVSLFYTDAGGRRFGLTRDALFLNGEPVPTVLRDSRELECSSRVTERVYRYDRYDDDSAGGHLWVRPVYRGHRGFSYGGYGPRWGGFGSTRPRSYSRPRSGRRSHPRSTPRPRSRPNTQTPYYPHVDPRIDGERHVRPRPRSDRGRTDLPTTTVRPDIRRTPTSRPSPRRAEPSVRRPAPRSEPTPRPAPRQSTPPSPTPRPSPTVSQRVAPASRPLRRPNPNKRSRVIHDMFPGDGYDDAVVVSSHRDCAREDQLVVFIPNDRLDAARFDGLTLILRDVTHDPRSGQTTVYDERPLYIPANYIEGFRAAMSQS